MSKPNWSDLAPRVISGVVMAVLGVAFIWAGGDWFRLAIAAICGGMCWELVSINSAGQKPLSVGLGVLGTLALILAIYAPGSWAAIVLLVPGLVAAWLIKRHWMTLFLYGAMILMAGLALTRLRDVQGAPWLIWLIGVVVASDVAGYFAGRAIGGPKFWPAISPKKTWSGTVAGWILAAIIGLGFGLWAGRPLLVVAISVVLSFAAQMGDIAESAIKRRAGVKDSSNLIPGHGGLMDRFDGVLGAAFVLLVTSPWSGILVVAGH